MKKFFKFGINTIFLIILCLFIGNITVSAASGQVQYTIRSTVTLHTEATNDSPKIAVPYMTKLVNLGAVTQSDQGSWIKIEYEKQIYYLWTAKGTEYLTDTKSTYSYAPQTDIQKEVLDKALYIYKNWDTKYAHGQSNGVPDTDGKYGFDCSGFVNYVIGNVMREHVPTYKLSANIEKLYNITEIYNQGTEGAYSAKTILDGELKKQSLKPGDVLFFSVGNEVNEKGLPYNHCGIYLGNNEFIHSTTSWGGGVCIMPLNDIYVEGFVSAKRYIPDKITTADQILYTTGIKNNIYPSMDSDGEPMATLDAEEPVTVKYTDNGNWAYVEYADGKYGFILVKYLGEKPDEISETYYVAKTSLKLYDDHTTDSKSLEVLIGTEVEYKGRYSNSSYYKVVYKNKEYYIYAPNGIDVCLTKDYDGLMKGITTAKVLANTKLRSSLSTADDSNYIRMIYAGDELTLIAQSDSGTWCYVKTADGQYGFLLSNKLEFEIPAVKGDVNEDGSANAIDALLILKQAASLTKLTEKQMELADLNSDRQVNAQDALSVLKIAAGIK